MPTKSWEEFKKFRNFVGPDEDNFWGVVKGGSWEDSGMYLDTAYVNALDNSGLPMAVRDSAADLPYLQAKEFLKLLGYELVHGHELKMRYEAGELE